MNTRKILLTCFCFQAAMVIANTGFLGVQLVDLNGINSATAQTVLMGQPPAAGWYPYVIAPRSDRATIQSTPVQMRPNRPFHVYGNVMRRNYYRSNTIGGTRTRVRIR